MALLMTACVTTLWLKVHMVKGNHLYDCPLTNRLQGSVMVKQLYRVTAKNSQVSLKCSKSTNHRI